LADDLREMGARQIVRWLATPARSGIFLGPADIQRLGAEIGVRVAPFNRTMGLEQLLRGAALDDRLDDALALLSAEMAAQLAAYRALELPALGPWIARAAATVSAWSAIEQAFLEQRETGE
jgi:hypothetical protein